MIEALRDYQVDLDIFRGPLDLLLYLVKRDEVDIRDIPIARVAEQYRQYLEVLRLIDVERAGEFLVMAATLMEIKSRMLLPQQEQEEGADTEDPRLELVRQLMEYKRFKEAAALLEAQADLQSRRLHRQPPPVRRTEPTGQARLAAVELWDLVSAFGRLMRETLANESVPIVVDQTPLHVHTENIVQRLRDAGRLPFSALFTPPHTRARLVGLFLAVLELTRRFRLLAEQDTPFGDIWVSLAPDPDQSAVISNQ